MPIPSTQNPRRRLPLPRHPSSRQRRAQGSALRDAVPREAQGGWKPPKKRRDPIDVLVASNEGRMPELVPIRFGRLIEQQPDWVWAAVEPLDLASTDVLSPATVAPGLRQA